MMNLNLTQNKFTIQHSFAISAGAMSDKTNKKAEREGFEPSIGVLAPILA